MSRQSPAGAEPEAGEIKPDELAKSATTGTESDEKGGLEEGEIVEEPEEGEIVEPEIAASVAEEHILMGIARHR